jgi:hypothetical protein
MGGIGTLPMDFGKSLQVPQQSQSTFTTTGSATSSPLLNYGQSQLGQAGGTPLTMAGGGMSRLGYQEGGIGMTQLGAPQEEPIFPRLETLNQNLGQAEQTLGSPSNNQFNISPMTSAFTGRSQMNLGGRIGYQEGGMDQMMQDPMMQEQMMQSQMQQTPEGIMSMMPQAASGGQQQGMPQEGGQEETALFTIIQLLIEQGVPPEKAEELAMQILQVFNQGGAPAVEEFANQLDQGEGMPENRTMMAGGGITGLYPRQGYFFKGVVKAVTGAVKGAAKAVKSIAKSPIGQIALAIAAPYAMSYAFGPAFATFGNATLGTFGGAALRAGISNLAIQGITTGKFNPKQALLAGLAGGALASFNAPVGIDQGTVNAGGTGIPGADIASTSTLSSGVTQTLPTSSFSDLTGQVTPGSMVYNPPTTAAGTYPSLGFEVSPTSSVVNVGATQPNIFQQGITSIKDFGTNLMTDPLKTIGNVGSSIYQTARENAVPLATGFLAGSSLAQQPNESDDEYASRAARDSNVAAYITQYGRGSKLYSPTFYSMEKAIDPFAGRNTFAANGGRIGYGFGNLVKASGVAQPVSGGDTSGGGFGMGLIGRLIQQNPGMFETIQMASRKDFIDRNGDGIDDRQQASYGGRMGYALGAEVPTRENQAGVTELDYRKQGGFVPPIGIKEKADDIPAMLSNNEFVFTADAVRNAGGGNVNKGAQRMYGLMKQLEAGGRV